MDGVLEFDVVFNHERQYSLWPKERELPAGWKKDGFSGTKDACLAHIESVWKDIRPQSLFAQLGQ